MLFVNCIVGKNYHIKAFIDSGTSINIIKKKYIDKMDLEIHKNDTGFKIEGYNESVNILGRVDLQTSFTVNGKYKTTDPIEFFILEDDCIGLDLILGTSWLEKNSAIVNMSTNQLTIHNNFIIPIIDKE